MARVVVGLSGGVDSSVAAQLLVEQGHEVIGLFMRNWHDDSVTLNNECPWVDDSNDALLVAQSLGIPFQVVDLSAEYKERIVDYMFAEYERGRTPNPDVLCNREIKFDIFLKTALQLGADYVATGHYCRKDTAVVNGQTVHRLLAGKDGNKDQSYFLCQLTQEQLSHALFPIGELEKPEVRRIAKAEGLVTAEKKDSQGLCFVGKIRLPDFLQQQLKPKKGKIIEISATHPMYARLSTAAVTSEGELEEPTLEDQVRPYQYTATDGEVVGEHNGAHYFTIGQRKGLQVGGKAKPLFVIETDTQANIVYVGQGEDHPGLNRPGLFIPQKDVHWIRPDLALQPGDSLRLHGRIRYRQAVQDCTLYQKADGLYVIFDELQRGVTPGQFFAWYQNDEQIGSGVIGG